MILRRHTPKAHERPQHVLLLSLPSTTPSPASLTSSMPQLVR
jgi:hypothetical protein